MARFRLIIELENPGLPYPIEKDRFNNPFYLNLMEQDMAEAGLLIEGEHITSTKLEAMDEGIFEEEMSLADEEENEEAQ